MLDVTERMVVIIGGGPVAARKARGLLEAGASQIRCVAPAFSDEFPAEVDRVPEAYRAEHLNGAALVFAATNNAEVNDAVVRDARERNILVNRADVDEDEPGDFAVPARLRNGKVVVAIAAGSPALAALIRDRLSEAFDPRWQKMAQAMHELRPFIKSAGIDIGGRRRIFRELATEDALNVVATRGVDGLRNWLLERHPEMHHA
jgi:precorrin-2 dehydrogenase/sirohydrochlorin ferrochelatase